MTDEIPQRRHPWPNIWSSNYQNIRTIRLISALPPYPTCKRWLPNFRLYPADPQEAFLDGRLRATPLPACCMVSFSL